MMSRPISRLDEPAAVYGIGLPPKKYFEDQHASCILHAITESKHKRWDCTQDLLSCLKVLGSEAQLTENLPGHVRWFRSSGTTLQG